MQFARLLPPDPSGWSASAVRAGTGFHSHSRVTADLRAVLAAGYLGRGISLAL
jgi:hypothetical protein